MNEIEKIIELCQESLTVAEHDADGTNPEYEQEQILLYKVALKALREKQEREKGCEYCNKQLDLEHSTSIEPSLYIKGNTLVALRYNEPNSNADINFCPKCGRHLGETQ